MLVECLSNPNDKKSPLVIGNPRSRLFQYHGSARSLIPKYNRSVIDCCVIVVSCRKYLFSGVDGCWVWSPGFSRLELAYC